MSPFPAGVRSLTPNLVLPDCARAIAFYEQAFAAKELGRTIAPGGRSIWHAVLQIGDSVLYLNDPQPNEPLRAPSGEIWIYGASVDERYARAVEAGATALLPVATMFWGDRCGKVVDPFGQTWTLAMHVADPTPEEIKRASEALAKGRR